MYKLSILADIQTLTSRDAFTEGVRFALFGFFDSRKAVFYLVLVG